MSTLKDQRRQCETQPSRFQSWSLGSWSSGPSVQCSYSIQHTKLSHAMRLMLWSNHAVCSDWYVLVPIAETVNKLSLRRKTALFEKLQYFLPLVQQVSVLLLPKTRNMAVACSLLKMLVVTTFVLHMNSNCHTKSEQPYIIFNK